MPDQELSPRRMSEGRTAWIAAILVGLGPVSFPLFAPALPAVAGHFDVTPAAAKAALMLYLAGYISMLLIAGPISDRFGRKPVLLVFSTLFVAASLGTLFATDMNSFLLARLLQGVGASAGVAVGRAVVLDQFPGLKSVPVMTTISLILAVGPALAPAAGGAIAYFGGWRMTLLTMLAMGLVQIAVICFLLPETRSKADRRSDGAGLLRDFSKMLRTSRFTAATVCNAGAALAYYAQAILLPFLILTGLGHSELTYALATLAIAAAYILGNTLSRRIQRRMGFVAPIPVGVGLLLAAALSFAAAFAADAVNLTTLIVSLSFSSAAGALIFPSMIPLALLPFRAKSGTAASLNMFVMMMIALGMSWLVSLCEDPAMGLVIALTTAAALASAGWLVWRSLADRMSES